MQRDDWLVMDVETTGLGPEAEVVEAAIIGNRGDTLFDAVVRPRTPPEPQASKVHGLHGDVLRNQPRFEQVYGRLATSQRTRGAASARRRSRRLRWRL